MVNDPTFDNGDDVSISVLPHSPTIQVRTIGIRWLHQEEGKDDDDIQSKDEVINAHNSSDDAHAVKVEIASRIFINYYCCNLLFNDDSFSWWQFRNRGL